MQLEYEKDTVTWQLVPSATQLKWTGSSHTPSSLSCRIIRNNGTESTELTETPDGLGLHFFVNGVDAGVLAPGETVPVGVFGVRLTSVEFRLIRTEDSLVVARVSIGIYSDGENGKPGSPGPQGKRGAIVPTPRLWKDYPEGYAFKCGADGEERLDIVLHEHGGKVWSYACKKSHTKGPDYEPADGAKSAEVWETGQQWTYIATRVLLAEFARIENLCAEFIRMLDGDGNVVFEAVGGDVRCNRGTFRNVDVEGRIIAGDKNGKHILLDPETRSVRVYDDNGNECARLDGSTWLSSQVKPGGGGDITVTLSKAALRAEGTGSMTATDSKDVTGAHSTSAPGAIRVQLTASVSMDETIGTDSPATGTEKPTIMQGATLWCVVTSRDAAGNVINRSRQHIVEWAQKADGSAHTESATRTVIVAVPAGKHTVSFELQASGSTATATVDTGSVKLVADSFMARYFGNGFALTQNTLSYLIALYESGRMKLMLGGDFYVDDVKQPATVYAGRVADSTKAGSTGATKTDLVYPGTSSGVTLTKGARATDGYTLTFPAKYGLTAANSIIELTGWGAVADDADSPAKATVKSVTAGSAGALTVVVVVSDDSSPNFGGFQIKVSKV